MEKLTKENIYVPLEGKSKEELNEIVNFLESIKEETEEHIRKEIHIQNTLEFYNDEWLTDDSSRGKQEVTIQQLKEILQPMENTKFKKDDVIIITDFGRVTSSTHTTNFTLNKPYVLEKDFNKENGLFVKIDDNKNKRNGWSNAFDLGIKIELYKVKETLTEQLEKAKAEVERLQKEINKPRVGDWVFDYKTESFYKLKDDLCFDKLKKIQDQELINKLNELIK